MNTITTIQVSILKAENQIFKAAVANPQIIQQFNTIEPNTDEEEDSKIQRKILKIQRNILKIRGNNLILWKQSLMKKNIIRR